MSDRFDAPPLFRLDAHRSGIAAGSIDDELVAVASSVIGEHLARPKGPLAGHNTGTPIESRLGECLRDAYGTRAKRPYEVLNAILENHPSVTSQPKRRDLFGRESAQELLCAGRDLRSWTKDEPFSDAQSDTADFVLFNDEACALEPGRFDLIDVKSANLARESRPPNIISGSKLFDVLLASVSEGAVVCDLKYLAVGFMPRDDSLEVTAVRALSLFKVEQKPYINWKAGTQLQFDPFKVDQDFDGSALDWANEYIEYYCDQRARKIAKDSEQLRGARAAIREARARLRG